MKKLPNKPKDKDLNFIIRVTASNLQQHINSELDDAAFHIMKGRLKEFDLTEQEKEELCIKMYKLIDTEITHKEFLSVEEQI